MTTPITPEILAEAEEKVSDLPEAQVSAESEFINSILKKDSEQELIIEPDIFSWGPWSSSKVKCLVKCPFQYYLKYILKIKVPETWQTQSDPTSANVGKAAHSILELAMIGKPIDLSIEATKKEYISKGLLSEEVWKEKVDVLHYNIHQFVERMEEFGKKHKIKRVLTELRVAINDKYESTGFFDEGVWLRGVIDLVVMLDNGDILILDHKTGGGMGSVKNYSSQLDWYKVLFHFGINPIEGAQTGVHFIGAGEIKMDEYSSRSDIEEKVKNSVEFGIECAIDGLKDKGYFKHVRGPQCKWCEFDNLGCKDGSLKKMELGTKRFFQNIPIVSE